MRFRQNMTRLLSVIFLTMTLLSGAGCAAEEGFFILKLIGPEPSAGLDGVTLDAVDQIRITLDPQENVDFSSRTEMDYDEGDVTTRVTTAGEFIITLQRGYLQRNSVRGTVGFVLDVPLVMETAMLGEARDPALFIEFLQTTAGGTVPIASFRRALPWPLDPERIETVTVRCIAGMQTQCLDER